MTSELFERVGVHKQDLVDGFTKRYGVHRRLLRDARHHGRRHPARRDSASCRYRAEPCFILARPLFGPILGGFITTYFHWRWLFWANVPVGFVSIALAVSFIPELRDDERSPLDLFGFVLSGLGISSLVFGLTAGGGHVIPGIPGGLLIITGGALVSAYAWHAKRVEAPIFDLKLLSRRNYQTGLIGGFVFRAAVGAIPFLWLPAISGG